MIKKFLFGFIILSLVLLSLFPRSIDVLNGNPVFGIDGGRDYVFVKNIVVNKKPTLIGAELGAGQAGLQYLFNGPGYFYVLTIPFILFNGNPVGGVFVMLLFGLAAIVFGVYFVTKWLGFKYGLLMGFLLALCPYFIGQSRHLENHFSSTFYLLLLFFFVYLFTKNKKRNSLFLFLSSFISAFVYNFEFALAVPLCIALVVYAIYFYRTKFFSKIPIILAGFILGFSPMILFEIRHGFMGIQGLFNYIFIAHKTDPNAPPLLSHARGIINLFIYTFSDSFPGRLLIPSNVINVVFVGFMTLVLFVFAKQKDKATKNFLTYVLLLFPVNFFVFLILRNIIFEHYITDLIIAYYLLFIFTLWWLFKKKFYKLSFAISVYLLILLIAGIINAYSQSKHDFGDYGGIHKLKGKTDAIDYIYKDAKGKPFSLFVFAPTIYTYPYDYIVWWHGERKYGYSPTQEKKGTFYLLIEVDNEKPWSYKGWKETVIKTGKVVYTKTLPNGFIVEKRMGN